MQTFVSLGYLKDTGTPKGRGVFASRPITEGEVVELCPAIVLTPLRALPEALQNYVYCWSKLAKGPPSSALALGYGSMYNHDNPSNLRYEALPDIGCMRFIAVRYIEAHEELTINYEAKGGGLESDLGNGWFDGAGIPPLPNPLPERRRLSAPAPVLGDGLTPAGLAVLGGAVPNLSARSLLKIIQMARGAP